MRQDRLVGRPAARAAGFQQRGMEPAAMLIGAFEIERGRPFEIGPLLKDEAVGRAAVEPDIDDVHHLVVIRGITPRPKEKLGSAV